MIFEFTGKAAKSFIEILTRTPTKEEKKKIRDLRIMGDKLRGK